MTSTTASTTPSNYKPVIFVNLPVKSLSKSLPFYLGLGFIQTQHFSSASAAMITLPDADGDRRNSQIHFMLLEHDRYTDFLPAGRTIPDPKSTAQVLLCISQPSRQAVDDYVEKAKELGANIDLKKPQDHGFMYGRGFEDGDGHIWEVMWMEPSAYENKE